MSARWLLWHVHGADIPPLWRYVMDERLLGISVMHQATVP